MFPDNVMYFFPRVVARVSSQNMSDQDEKIKGSNHYKKLCAIEHHVGFN